MFFNYKLSDHQRTNLGRNDSTGRTHIHPSQSSFMAAAISRLRVLTSWRKRRERGLAIAAVFFALLLFYLALFSPSRSTGGGDASSLGSSALPDLVPLTLIRTSNDAVCLDGSFPGYHFQKGFGSGSDSWVLHFEGGGWCDSIESCSLRSSTKLGSSKYMERHVPFSGILSRVPSQNPDFFNWNKVKIRYCDGASFAGHPSGEFKNGTRLFFRGQFIWESIIMELLSLGMLHARQALLSGCSAGGLATLIHCDDFSDLFSKDTTVKCLADAGFFLDELDVSGNYTMRSFYHDVVHLQAVVKSLPEDCVASMEPSKCFFPEELMKNIRTPVFVVNPAYDFWQIQNVLVPHGSEPDNPWHSCRLNIYNCNPSQMLILQGFRAALLRALNQSQKKEETGMFINSCFIHCQTWMSETWHGSNSPRIKNKTIAEAVGDWYFNRKAVKLIDCCPFTCNPTCYNMDFTQGS